MSTIQTQQPDERGYFGYTIMDADAGERFATTDYVGEGGYDSAVRRRSELALSYGKEFALVVAGIDGQGNLHEVDEGE